MPVGSRSLSGSAGSRGSVLIITNGDHAAGAIARAGIEGEVLSWIDVLHEGPVPADLSLNELALVRARFFAELGWGAFEQMATVFQRRDDRLRTCATEDEVLLWFEHDLFDQLQLVQVLDWFTARDRRPRKLTMICHDHFVGPASLDQLRSDFAGRALVTDQQIALAADAWAAVRSATPEPWVALSENDSSALPFLASAFDRLLEELPGRDGLARSERQILRVVADGARDAASAFTAAQALEEAAYLGDATFLRYVARLIDAPIPLVSQNETGMALSDIGRAVLDGREDFIRVGALHRWLGGVRLCRDNLWRWDPERRALRHTSAA